MIRPQTLHLHQFRTLLNLRYPSPFHPQNPKPLNQTPSIHTKSLTPTSLFTRSISLSSQFQNDTEDGEFNHQKLNKNLRKLELELRTQERESTKETKGGGGGGGGNQEPESKKVVELGKLSNLFSSSNRRGKSRTECRKVDELIELSPDMAVFASHLHKKGYFVKANFLPNNKFDVSCFVNKYGMDFLKFAAEEFAKDHREIYKWLPTGDLKKVAQFGCPSLGRKNVFSAKAMRFCFGIPEETVCKKCALKDSCKFANQSVWKKGAKNMDLTVVMRVVTLYALPTRLEVSEDVRDSVSRLLKEVIRLSEIEC